ncbi:hypothetical protein ACP70R_046030 [Stipagrostis hirtigluma subsp. patula]
MWAVLLVPCRCSNCAPGDGGPGHDFSVEPLVVPVGFPSPSPQPAVSVAAAGGGVLLDPNPRKRQAEAFYSDLPRRRFMDPNSHDNSNEAEFDLNDFGEVNSRCAVRLVHEVISRFDSKKRELVKAIGFGGLLLFPDLNQINRRLSVWLMSKVDEATQSIVIDSNRRYKFSKEDVRIVFGIPSEGTPVQEIRADKIEDDHEFVRTCLGVRGKDYRSIKAAQEILDRQYGEQMSRQEVDAFKVAFVVFIISALLAPSTRHDCANTDYWAALSRIDMIAQYDWCSYVIYRLLIACSKLKSDIRKKLRSPTLTGCTLFLQILYLDSTNLGALSMAHEGFPRCRWFTTERLRTMAAADVVKSHIEKTESDFGASLPRPAAEVAYTWAQGSTDESYETNGTNRIFSAALAMVDASDIPYEAAAPIYIAILQHHRAMQEFHDAEAAKLIEVVTSIAKSFKRGFFYSSPLAGNKRCALPSSSAEPSRSILKKRQVAFSQKVSMRWPDGSESEIEGSSRKYQAMWDESAPSFDLGIDGDSDQDEAPLGTVASLSRHPIHELRDENALDESDLPLTQCPTGNWYLHTPSKSSTPSDSKDSPISVNKAMSEYYLWSRQVKANRFINLNVQSSAPQLAFNHKKKLVVGPYRLPSTPWNLGQKRYKPSKQSMALYRWLCTLQPHTNITEPWIVHSKPKDIELTMYELHEQVTGRSEFEIDFMDICIRCIRQHDDSLYPSTSRCRWRHLMEADFMAGVIAGKRITEIESIAEQLLGEHLSYDIPSCRFIFFPGIVNQRWVCYAWDLAGHEVVVYDPLIHEDQGGSAQPFHRHVVSLISDAMTECSKLFFTGWSYSWTQPKIHIHHSFSDPPSRNRSGVYTALFCRCFDGSKNTLELKKENCNHFAGLLFLHALQIKGNSGKLPQMYEEIMRGTH